MDGSGCEEFCSLCGYDGTFTRFHPDSSLRETRCPACGSGRRNRDVVRVLLRVAHLDETIPLCRQVYGLRHLRIFELQAAGPVHAVLNTLPHYHCSEYLPAVAPGNRNDAGVLCQDATALTYADGLFDVVISQDILEHIDNAQAAFLEINRVLRRGGTHIFTVPVQEGSLTRRRARRALGGEVEYLLPPVYHGDPLNPSGALVWWDYGDDLVLKLKETGIDAAIASQTQFYGLQDIPRVDTEAEYARYERLRSQKQLSRFFLYNSVVFVARKP